MAVTHTLAAHISELQHREDSFLTSYSTLLDTHLSVCTLLISELLLRIVKDGKAMQAQVVSSCGQRGAKRHTTR